MPPIGSRFARFAGRQCPVLVADVHGPEAGPSVLLLHGGGQTRHAWGDAARRLGAAGWNAVALDLPGHGDSAWIEGGDYSLPAMAAEIAAVAETLPRPLAVVGASLGGLSAMGSLLLDPPLHLDALVLVDVAPRTESAGVERVLQFMSAYPEGFPSLDEAAQHIARYRGRAFAGAREGLRKNLRRLPSGRWAWHWDPRLLDPTHHEQRRDPALYERALHDWRGPTLLVRGVQSDVVSREGARDLLRIVPSARWVDLEDAGHMVAGDANDAFADAVIAFLSEVLPPAKPGAVAVSGRGR